MHDSYHVKYARTLCLCLHRMASFNIKQRISFVETSNSLRGEGFFVLFFRLLCLRFAISITRKMPTIKQRQARAIPFVQT